jgi:hypothetical protein
LLTAVSSSTCASIASSTRIRARAGDCQASGETEAACTPNR